MAEKSFVPPWAYDPQIPRIVWYYRVLALHNARANAEGFHQRKRERQAKMASARRRY